VAAVAVQQIGGALEGAQHVEGRDAAAGSVGDLALDRQHDRGPVEGLDELGGDDPDDAAMPALAGHDQHVARADVGVAFDARLRLGDDRLLLLLAALVLAVERLGQLPRLVRHRLVDEEEEPCRQVGRAHAAGRVEARREHERDVVAVDRPAGEPRGLEQGAEPDRVPSRRQLVEAHAGEHAVLPHERHDVGERAEGGHLDERREPPLPPVAPAQGLDELEDDPGAGQILVRIGAVAPPRIDDGDGGR